MNLFNDIKVPASFKAFSGTPSLKLKFAFRAHCRIFFTPEKYKDLENHLYIFYVTVNSPVNDIGMGVDFFEVEHIFENHIKPLVDHQLLNQTLPAMNMTAENIGHWLYQTFEAHLPVNTTIEALELFETAEHSVILTQQNRH
ncbi:6-pyruvoyl tetrahydropterin synthase [Macrococcus brunensis]|uniref:6-carboxy-5,6,7,8-tetrahydropterin synthase n=1 Tax=Macrococcus brunensis TaxID=198483 RepID=A0A4R6BF45_9STAP|nr:6-carboxytetrahydropterin synthase [Macrococcus brunensis]TDL98389.1 6-pyruvoyl tetrahydropterin synthase [Macrococcus brunensis]ULG74305.1 6-carboxytetrahydropterin synthase [Macrococcus brunensis]